MLVLNGSLDNDIGGCAGTDVYSGGGYLLITDNSIKDYAQNRNSKVMDFRGE